MISSRTQVFEKCSIACSTGIQPAYKFFTSIVLLDFSLKHVCVIFNTESGYVIFVDIFSVDL